MRYLDAPGPGPRRWSVMGLGTWQFGTSEWGYGDALEAGRIVARARELGVTVFDTAELYGPLRRASVSGARAARFSGSHSGLLRRTALVGRWPASYRPVSRPWASGL